MNARINRPRGLLVGGTTLVLAVSMLAAAAPVYAAGPATVGLGSAGSFAILAGTPAITNTGSSTIYGNVGIHPAAAVTGFPPGLVHGVIHKADAVALAAKRSLVIAYNNAAGRPKTATHGTLGGLTLVAGVYNAGGVTLRLTGTLTLDAQHDPNAVWIFQATSDLVTASSSTVRFINGGQACHVFWQVTSSATLGSGSTFAGTIMALTSITMNSGVTLHGRALARNGKVTLINDTISRPTCSSTSSSGGSSSGGSSSGGSNTPATDTILSTDTHGPGTPAILFVGIFAVAFAVTVAVGSRRRTLRPRNSR